MKFCNLLVALLILISTSTAVWSKDVEVKGYTKKDGTVVKGYTKTVKDKDKTQVKGYTKKDGTVVSGYSRKKAKSTAK